MDFGSSSSKYYKKKKVHFLSGAMRASLISEGLNFIAAAGKVQERNDGERNRTLNIKWAARRVYNTN